MHVPVDLCACVKGRVDGGEEASGEGWGSDMVDEEVEDEGEEDFVDVEGKGGEVERGGEGLDERDEEGGRRGEWVEHGELRS